MYNRLSLKIMKFFVDFVYYALPLIFFLCKASFYILIAFVFLCAIAIIL